MRATREGDLDLLTKMVRATREGDLDLRTKTVRAAREGDLDLRTNQSCKSTKPLCCTNIE